MIYTSVIRNLYPTYEYRSLYFVILYEELGFFVLIRMTIQVMEAQLQWKNGLN